MPGKYVYNYVEAVDVGRERLGGKGAGLAEMRELGIPVPEGLAVTTAAWVADMQLGRQLPTVLEDEIRRHVALLEDQTAKRLGDSEEPLLVSVRSGAAVSMPGMMDTILNLGLTQESTEALGRSTGNVRFVRDA